MYFCCHSHSFHTLIEHELFCVPHYTVCFSRVSKPNTTHQRLLYAASIVKIKCPVWIFYYIFAMLYDIQMTDSLRYRQKAQTLSPESDPCHQRMNPV